LTLSVDPADGLDDVPRWAYGAGMALRPGNYHSGPDRGHLIVRTSRQGIAATAGHDLVIEITGWSAEITVGDDGAAAVTARIDLGTLVVREGTGGLKPLSDRDRREIAHTARKLLDTDRRPEAVFTSSSTTQADAGGSIEGTLTLCGTDQRCTVDVKETRPGHYEATTSVLQSAHGIKPYTAFFGTLKLADRVQIQIDVDGSGWSDGGG
jgi:polyisoprenoid-binding protein YceI